MNGKLLVVIPTYNVQDCIIQAVRDITDQVDKVDILAVDHGSSDRTVTLLENNRVPHLKMPIKSTYYRALQLGMEYAFKHDYEGVIEFDPRGCFKVADIKSALTIFWQRKTDLVLMTRFSRHGYNLTRHRFKIFVVRLTIKMITRKTISDPMLRFRIYGKAALDFFIRDTNIDPATDAIAQLIRRKLSYCELNIKQDQTELLEHYDKETRFDSWWETTYFACSILLVQPFKLKQKETLI